MRLQGREARNVGKVQIQCDEATRFRLADLMEALILDAAQVFLRNGLNVMACIPKELLGPLAEVLIEFEPHEVVFMGISTYRWRDISAP